MRALHALPASLLVGAWLLVALPLVAADMPSARTFRKAEKLVRHGQAALEAGRLEEADRAFSEGLETLPGHPDAHVGRGQVAMRAGRFEDALGQFRAARESYSRLSGQQELWAVERYARAQDELTRVRDRLRDLEAELQSRDMGIGEGSRTPEASLRGSIRDLERRERELEAIRQGGSERAIESPPFLDFLVGNAAFRLGRRNEALQEWESCARRDPEFGAVHSNLAVLLGQLGRFEDAWRHLERARELGIEPAPGLEEALRREEQRRANGGGDARR